MNLITGGAMYAAGVVVCFGSDLIWLGVVARDFYQRELGRLMRPDIQWAPGILFYLIYVGALLFFVATPAVARQSLGWAVGAGAFFGLAAYAAFDLTGLALFRDFSRLAAVVDLCWGAALSAFVSAMMYLVGRAMIASSPIP